MGVLGTVDPEPSGSATSHKNTWRFSPEMVLPELPVGVDSDLRREVPNTNPDPISWRRTESAPTGMAECLHD